VVEEYGSGMGSCRGSAITTSRLPPQPPALLDELATNFARSAEEAGITADEPLGRWQRDATALHLGAVQAFDAAVERLRGLLEGCADRIGRQASLAAQRHQRELVRAEVWRVVPLVLGIVLVFGVLVGVACYYAASASWHCASIQTNASGRWCLLKE
jgi:uncharacterized protein YukE